MATDSTNGATSAPVAIVTGGASGMGLAVTRELVAKGWNVAILDYNEDSWQSILQDFDQDHVTFMKTDVMDYEQQSRAFVQTWKRWQKLDFVFSNAGFGDKINFYATVEDREDGSPPKPDTSVIDVCLDAMVYSAYLALHYFRKNGSKGGKLVFTSSMAGLYPGGAIPLYTAAKHGVVGMTRALAQRLEYKGEKITVNCICPGLVSTGLTQRLIEATEDKYITPSATIVRAVMGFVDDATLNGQVAECSLDKIYYKKQPEFSDEEAEYVMSPHGRLAAAAKEKGITSA